jgi:hypothetical protein
MVLAANIAGLLLAIVLGKRIEQFTYKHYIAAALIAAAQAAIAATYMFIMKKPPLF